MGEFIGFFSTIFGYVLNFIYEIVKNYGLAIIIFSVIIKIVLLPLSIKQQKTLKKSSKMQEEMKKIQEKYKDNQEKINQETLDLYKREKMSPFSGCFSAIIQLILILAMFFLVSKPLTFMKQIDEETISNYEQEIRAENPENARISYPEISIIKEKGQEDPNVNINMNFLGLDLSSVPTQNVSDFRVYVIPILYVISSIVSMKITSNMTNNKKKEEVIENENKDKEKNELDAVAQANKSMMWMMPIMSVTIALVAPLGLALYWLVNNILITIEKIVLNKFLVKED